MSDRGKGKLELEEEEIKNLFLGIMEGYNDTVIPPFSYFSPLQGISISENGSSSIKRERDEAIWAENLLRERKRRKQMNEKFSVLQSMVPSLSKTNKPPREKIINDTVKYIKYLEEEIHRLEGLRKQPWQEPKEAKPVLSKCMNHNSSVNVTTFIGATFFAIELPFRRCLMTEIAKVFNKHHAEILEARIFVNDEKLLTFTATLMLHNDGCYAIAKMKEELQAL